MTLICGSNISPFRETGSSMPEDRPPAFSTLTLNTKVEEDFVSPLTSLRGALEILRDFPDLSTDERDRFLNTALSGCARLEQSVQDLARSVYAAGQQAEPVLSAGLTSDEYRAYADRVDVLEEMNIIELDFSYFEFSSSRIVNDFYDVIEWIVDQTGHDWYFVVNFKDCSVWPEAWIAFAHRGKRINVSHALGTVRYASREGAEGGHDPNLLDSRDAAFAEIEKMKSARTA
jgi:hypothetical protein